ncbi:MAG: DUF4160 domain-containing protein [Dehalococcoidia bacterium]|nr:DUF4160 domain-containing protein [Dehalococcoidia bacterium]
MPTIATEGQFRFVVYTRENEFEPPHVHVFVGSEHSCRIELNNAQFMDQPPAGYHRRILEAYRKHAEAIRKTWDAIHQR